jgi:cytochrome c nitrite reductase small subunit
MLGVLAGAGLFVTYLSRAPSYLSDNPETCVNCHVMTTQYITWQHSSHALVATCNDCHVPHDNVAHHYLFKAQDGLRHAGIFTLRLEPQVIQISQRAVPVVQENCRRCHAAVVENVSSGPHGQTDRLCWDCHREVPHGRSRSLSTTLDTFRPQLAPIITSYQDSEIQGRPARPAKEGEPHHD